jgi:capsular polysaccharide biosynthesis protein
MTAQRFFNIIKRRAIVVWCVLAVGLGLIYALRHVVPATYAGVAHVVLVAENGARDPSVGIVDLPSIATSTVVLERVRDSLNLPVSLIDLKSNVSASVLGKSSIMAIGYRDESAERAISVSNAVADELSRYYDEISTARYDVNVDRLSTELRDESDRTHALDRQISQVVAANPFVVSDKSVDNITTQLASLDDQHAAALAQLDGDEALADATLPNPALAKIARHEMLAGDPAYTTERNALGADEAQLATDEAGYTGAFPGLPGELAKIGAEASGLHREAARAVTDVDSFSAAASDAQMQHRRQLAVLAGDRARLAQVNRLIATERSYLNALPTTGAKYSQLVAERDALQTEYAALATRRANALANRAEASSLGSVVVLDRAIKADTQLAGGRTRAAVVAFILVVAFAMGTALLVESLDPRIRRPEEVEELYGIPVVASFGAKA